MNTIQPSKKLIPRQMKGSRSDTSHSLTMKTVKEAMELFSMAKNRLLDVSNWDKLCGPLSGTFFLTDDLGTQVDQLAIPGDYLKIDIPGPGSKSGDGYDWVKIEAIEEDLPTAAHEGLTMKVRPAQNPKNNNGDTAHFFKNEATSTFIVRREKNKVIAEVHGRNELPNVNAKKPLDTIRNSLLSLTAMLGLSSSQWKKLVKGLVSLKKLR